MVRNFVEGRNNNYKEILLKDAITIICKREMFELSSNRLAARRDDFLRLIPVEGRCCLWVVSLSAVPLSIWRRVAPFRLDLDVIELFSQEPILLAVNPFP